MHFVVLLPYSKSTLKVKVRGRVKTRSHRPFTFTSLCHITVMKLHTTSLQSPNVFCQDFWSDSSWNHHKG